MLPPHKTRNSYSDFGIQFVPKDKISHRASIIIKARFRRAREREGRAYLPNFSTSPTKHSKKKKTFRMTSEKTGKTSSREVRSKRKILSQKSGDRENSIRASLANPVSQSAESKRCVMRCSTLFYFFP
ncbi:hypothetical protein TNIN_62031 [Trichonephila inaurata madagascariensis]|uniref:Uncharacterized protein n=1 Tax=Trichonephila inaurata madagascariensis TaxID=2747483 RepID=A0A8X6XMS1_9ARAC|nr:hypothetical protein TNIN_62031 [Trichonephila inaurata madagascariensis]